MKKRRGSSPDWVYRGFEYDADTGAPYTTQVASFTGLDRNGGAYTLAVGTPAGLILYDSADYITQGVRLISAGSASMMGRESRAEGRRPTIHAVEGTLYLQPTSWTAGTDFVVGARIVICDQNLTTGSLDLPANYTILGSAVFTNIDAEPSVWANGWGNLKTAVLRQAFATENDMARFQMRLSWRGRRTLQPNTCLGIYIESGGPAVGSTSIRFGARFRTLVTDPNS